MATYYARKSGNIDATDVWATTPSGTAGAQTFASGDVLVANSFTVTVNVTTNLGSTGEVRNDTTGGATAGGSFSLSNGVTLTANVFAGSATCVTLTGTASATVVGNITGGSGSAVGVLSTSTGTLAITGSVTAGSGANGYGASLNAGGTMTIVGNLTSGSSTAEAARNDASSGGGTVVITGNVTGGSNAACYRVNANATVTITGTVTGGSATGAYGVLHNQASTVSVVGTCVGGSGGVGALHVGSGTFSCTRAKGGPLASSAAGVGGSTTGSTSVEEVEWGDLGASPTAGAIRLTNKTSNVAVMYRFGTTKKTLTDPNASGIMPAESNVRSGTVYNGGNSTGTCAVPAASSVAFGVPVDATTGTAALTPAAVWDYLTANANTSGSMGERLKNAATVASVGQALSDALTP